MARKNVQPPQPRGVHNKETRAIVQKHVEGIIQSSAKVADLQFRNVALQTKYAVMSEGVKEKEHKVAVQTAVLTLSLLSVPGQSFSSNDKLKKMSDEEKQLINDLNTENITRQAAMLDQSTARIDPSIGNLSEKTQDQLKSLQDELSSPTGRFATLNPVQRETLKQNVALAQRMQENASNETPFTIKNQKDLQKLITQNDMSALQIDKSIGNLSLKSEESLQELKQKITSGTGKYQNLSSTERKELTTRVDFALKTKDKKSSLAKSLKAGRKTDFSGRKIKGVMSMVATAAIATSDDQTIRGMRNMKSMAHMSKMMKGVAVETGKISYMFAKASILGTANYASMGLKLAGKTDAAEKIKNFETKWNNTEGFVTKTIPGKITEHKQTKRAHKAQKKEERNVRVRAVGARISNTRMARPIVNVSRGVRVKAAQFANTKGGKAVIKVGKVGKSAIRMPFKAVNVMSKVFQVFTNTAEALKQLALTLVKKLAVKILVPIISSSLPVVTQVLMFFAPIICLMFVTAAISDSLTEFKEHTSMGAAYDKLLDKEAQFSAAILSTVDHANGSSGLTIPQNIQDEYGITSFTATDAKYIDGNGNETSNTSTIKQILSMAAVYIEQDFDKYGAFLDGTLTDSVYKDYCAKLYDSSHIIAYAEPDYDESEIYYCLNESDGEGASYVETATKKPAMIDCNNKSDSTICYVNEYTTTAEIEEDKRKYTCVVRETDNVSNNGNSGHEKHTYTPIQTGIHGKTAAFSYENTDGIVSSYDRDLEEKMQELRDKGCENPIEITYQEYDSWNTNRSSSYKKNMVVCGCSFCRGHIDLPVYVFISNAHDPSYDDPSEQVTEMRYSLYAIDKYATAFDGATIEVFCTNPDCPAYDSSNSIEPPRINISIANPECPFCHTDYSSLLDGRRVVDQASVDEARAVTDQYAGEKAIMDRITGKDCTIYDWWDNTSWFNSAAWEDTYYRLLDNGVIEGLERPDESAQDRNVVNASNSSAFMFRCFSSSSGRNNDFASHGWDSDSIDQARLLMCADWEEAYGITDFGGVNTLQGVNGLGAYMSQAQISQILNNNTDYRDLSTDRQKIMFVALEFANEINRLQVGYHGGSCRANSLSDLRSATSRSDVFTIGDWSSSSDKKICKPEFWIRYDCKTKPGIDCSGFVSWIAYEASKDENGGNSQFPKKETTRDMCTDTSRLIPVTYIQPGDILLKDGHVMLYLGNGKVAHASGHSAGIKYNDTVSAEYLAQFNVYRFSFVDDSDFSNPIFTGNARDLTGENNQEEE